jgi:hypothetical protein
MRFIALDGHRDFCEVAIKDDSRLGLAGLAQRRREPRRLKHRPVTGEDSLAARGEDLLPGRVRAFAHANVLVSAPREEGLSPPP